MKFHAAGIIALVLCVLTSHAPAQTVDEIREAQQLLIRVDREPGPVDGVWGRRTESALVDFLAERGIRFDGALSESDLELLRSATEGPRYVRRALGLPSTLPNVSRNNRDQPEDEPATRFQTWDIPEYVNPNPNLATLRFYLRRHLEDSWGFRLISVDPGTAPRPLSFSVQENRFLNSQINHTSLLSYLYFADGAVIHDELTPPHRFGDMVFENTPLRSNSIGKSVVSYLLGHAICAGYIDGLDARLDDWPLISGTLYENQRLIDLVNMRAGDQRAVSDTTGLVRSGRWYNIFSVGSFARDELAGTSPVGREGQRIYHYNGLVTNVVLNYIIHRAGDEFNTFMDGVFRDLIGIENRVFLFENRGHPTGDGAAWYMFYASRYDYLRIAMAILEDWNNETCVGRYLREVVARGEPKNSRDPDVREKFQSGLSYGGFFHLRYSGMERRNILGMDGYGGQAILIDLDNGRIVVANSVHIDYDWYQLVHQVIRNGRLP
jgi:peptidoglycan hydrolase-like protein with peptidoglycan-binding domain